MKYINIFLLIFWVGFIFSFSSDSGEVSQNKSNQVIESAVEWISKITHHTYRPEDIEKIIKKVSYVVRKTAHFLEYFILGILVINVFKDYRPLERKSLLLLFLVCVFYAMTDEFHQLFVVERSGQFTDVVIDSFGSFTGIFLYYQLFLRRAKKRMQNP